jgi:F0F1-type ATP synthase membrane subunit b/b'
MAITLLNYAMLFVPPKLTESSWWFALTTQLIEQGIIPLLGLGVFFTGVAIQLLNGTTDQDHTWIAKTEVLAYRLSLLFGILFVILAPIHGLATIANNQASIAALETRLAQQDEQVKFQLDRQRELYTAVLDGNATIEDLVGDEPLNEAQMEVLNQIKGDPKALDRQLQAAQEAIRESVQKRAAEAREQSKFGVLKSILRLGLTSWMLAGCYLNVAWIGLKGDKKPKVKVKRQPNPKTKAPPGDFL